MSTFVPSDSFLKIANFISAFVSKVSKLVKPLPGKHVVRQQLFSIPRTVLHGFFTSNISSSREESSLAGENSKDGIGMLIQVSESINCFLQELPSK
jgi:hypothetical protein